MSRRRNDLFFFGEEEKVASVQLIFNPLIQLIVRVKTGLLKKRFEDRFFVLDGIIGRKIEFEDGLVFKDGIEQFIGLNQQHFEVLKMLRLDRDSTLTDILSGLKISDTILRRMLKFLEERRLISTYKNGKIKLYHRMVELPKIELKERSLALENISTAKAEVRDVNLKEAEVREVVKGLFPGSDFVEFKPFLYPVYKVELILKGKNRVVWVDGRSGKKIDF